ncbi:MAG: thiamine pyrophosphokinase [Bifidobacteriaceae bacterium]|jgi:uncharacterized membrane-anchored protein|nr:thiamine pyrophosphokinase [Bifidobacteriaceae bacterium]
MMRLVSQLRRAKSNRAGTLHGPARVDRRTKSLTGRLKPGDVAVIDHPALDRVAAEALVKAQVAAVLNAADSSSSRFPNLGPEILLRAGIPLIDGLGAEVMGLKEGVEARVDLGAGQVRQLGRLVAAGQTQTLAGVLRAQELARGGMSEALTAFAANTLEYLELESGEFLDRQCATAVKTEIKGRTALIVVRGYHYREDLAVLRPFVREKRPVIIGVDGGADAVMEAGLKPDLIIGDMDSVSDKALRSGAELVVHAYRDGRAPGASRLGDLGLEHSLLPMAGTSEDVAMLVADDKGAELIVAVGTHMTVTEFLDKGREGMASTFLTRLRVGGKLVDAKGVSRLYRPGVSNLQLSALIVAGAVALAVALAVTQSGQLLLQLLAAFWDDAWAWVKGVMPG